MAVRVTANEGGFLSVEYMVATAFSLLFLVMMVYFVSIQFSRGVVRAAVDEGARAGALVVGDPLTRCNQEAQSVLENAGEMMSTVDVKCNISATQVRVTADATFEPWLPGVPAVTEHAVAVVNREPALR